MLAVLLGLGSWQVERLAWKEDLLARMAERRNAPPLTLASLQIYGGAQARRP